LNVAVFSVVRRSAGILFHALGAAMLNARSPNLSRERGTTMSFIVRGRSEYKTYLCILNAYFEYMCLKYCTAVHESEHCKY